MQDNFLRTHNKKTIKKKHVIYITYEAFNRASQRTWLTNWFFWFFRSSFVRPFIYLFFCLFLVRMNITHLFCAVKIACLSVNLYLYVRKCLRKSSSWSWSSCENKKITIHVHKYLHVYKYMQLYTLLFMKMLYTCAYDLSLRKFLLLFWTNVSSVRTPTRS